MPKNTIVHTPNSNPITNLFKPIFFDESSRHRAQLTSILTYLDGMLDVGKKIEVYDDQDGSNGERL